MNNINHKTIFNQHVGIVLEDNQVIHLFNAARNIDWLRCPSPLYEVESDGDIRYNFDVIALDNGQLKLSLTITNVDNFPVKVKPCFPILKNLSPDDNRQELCYCFPQMIPAIDGATAELRQQYSSLFPLQFLNVFHPTAGSVTLITQDACNYNKEYWLSKKENGMVQLGVTYQAKEILPNETWILPTALIDIQNGDWHMGLEAYKKSLQDWYTPLLPRKKWLQNTFNFRQHFLHQNYGDKAWQANSGEYCLPELVKKDIDAFGGIDYVQLFDWASDPKFGRVGEYNPWHHLGGHQSLRTEINKLQDMGIRVGLYLEGYLLDKRATIAQEYGEAWTVRDKDNLPYYLMGENYWQPCPCEKNWQRYLQNAAQEAVRLLGANGIYIDQYGWGTQYPCFSREHGHEVPNNQLLGENKMMISLREALPNEIVLLSEYCPTDVSTQYQDGSLTYAKGIVNLTRFALPDFKQFVIIRCDEPIGNDTESVKRIFFNGEGIWLAGPLSTFEWFPVEIRKLIKKTYLLLNRYAAVFSGNAIPLVDSLHKEILVNQYSNSYQTIWTCLNTSKSDVGGKMLKVKYQDGTKFFDLWNNREITVESNDGYTYLTFEIRASDVGCILQENE